MLKRGLKIIALFTMVLGYQFVSAQEPAKEPYVELMLGTLNLKGDRALSYTFHRFDPSLFLGSAHEHFNVDPFTGAEEVHAFRHLKVYYPLSELFDVELRLVHRNGNRVSSNEFFVSTYSGLGDMMLGGSYQWYNSAFRSGKEGTKMRLGILVALPTGTYENFSDDGELEPQMQAGKGAVGIQARHYLIRQFKPNTSVTWLLNYQYQTANQYGYQFGSSIYNKIAGQYQFGDVDRHLKVVFGLSHTYVQSDIMNNRKLYDELESGEDTGGQWVNVFLKAETRFKRLLPFVESEFPVWQQLFGQQFIRRNQYTLGLRFELRKKEAFNE